MSNFLYRPHRGGIDEAMKGLKEFNSLADLLKYVYENESFRNEEIGDISISLYSKYPDTRIGWPNTYIVCIKERGGCGWVTEGLSKKESLETYNKWRNRQ